MEQKKVALITGITGQDGSYLAELLLEKGYDVHGHPFDLTECFLIHSNPRSVSHFGDFLFI